MSSTSLWYLCPLSHFLRRLIRVACTISNPRQKLVVSGNLGPDTMDLLHTKEDLEVCLAHQSYHGYILFCGSLDCSMPEDRKCDRSWLLDNVAGATSAIVMLSDKVGYTHTMTEINVKVRFQIDEEFFEKGKASISVGLSRSLTLHSGT